MGTIRLVSCITWTALFLPQYSPPPPRCFLFFCMKWSELEVCLSCVHFATWALYTWPLIGCPSNHLQSILTLLNRISVNTDITLRSVASDLGVHCLKRFHLWTLYWHKWVNVTWYMANELSIPCDREEPFCRYEVDRISIVKIFHKHKASHTLRHIKEQQ